MGNKIPVRHDLLETPLEQQRIKQIIRLPRGLLFWMALIRKHADGNSRQHAFYVFEGITPLRLGDGGVGIAAAGAAVGRLVAAARSSARLAGLGGRLAGLVGLVEVERAALVATHP